MNILVVLARVPAPGSGKSRLRSGLDDEAVDLITAALVADTLDWSVPCADAVLVAHDGAPELLPAGGRRHLLVAQPPGDLGDRIDAAVAAAFDHGADRVVVVGTDCPTVPASLVESAFSGLSTAASTLVPATDGGWIALGVDRPLDGALRTVAWGTELAGRQTVEALSADGRPPLVLPAWHDIDHPDDLRSLHWDSSSLARAPRTAAVLAALSTRA